MASRKVYFAVFGSGLGHVTRVLEVAHRIRSAGMDIMFSSSGQGLGYLKAKGEGRNTIECPGLDVEWASGGFSSWHVLPGFPFMFNRFLHQLAFEREQIEAFDPDIVVSDSRLSAVLAARSKSYPVITMLNQFSIAFPPRFRHNAGRVYERIAGDGLGSMWALSEEVLMTDLPPPYTIGEANLVGSDVARVVRFVGFTTPGAKPSPEEVERARRMLDFDSRPVVFCQVSGPEPTKPRFVGTLLGAAEGLSKEFNIVISLGNPEGSTEPRKIAGGGWVFEWCPVKDELFAMADLLVARAGHSTIGQCINAAKPAVLVPIYNHPEQIGNASKFADLGLGMAIRSERLTKEDFTEAVESCLRNPRFHTNIEDLRRLSARYNGVEMCASIILGHL
jgi:UDP-N-acetylglucosamine--N-acetylmuramyl-(pentapeptide) pyrophosphoryl-undecaprenol N-acetylglucosamine transferase